MPPPTCAKCNHACDETKVCSKCRTNYCSKDCQLAHWPIHKPMCKPPVPDTVWGIKILCDRDFEDLKTLDDKKRFQNVRISKTDPIFDKGDKCPVLDNCGIPLLIYSPNLHDGKNIRQFLFDPDHWQDKLGNDFAVRFMMNIHDISSLLPAPWRMIPPGTCILARSDYRALTREAAETMLVWATRIFVESIEYKTSGGWAPTWQLQTPASFQLFSREYYEAQRAKKRLGFDEFFTPL